MATTLRRKIDAQLLTWKEKSQGRTAVLIEGARRVGKSFSAVEFARKAYDSYIVLDFNIVPEEIKSLFDYKLNDLDSFFRYLSAYTGTELHPRRSAIIFDEVQLFPRARAAVKYLVADGRFDYIETGSLMSIRRHVKDILIPSEEHRIKLHPLDFEEFLWACGESLLFELLRDLFGQGIAAEQGLHRKAMELFRQYMLVGGMPQAVNGFLSADSFFAVEIVKREILDLYRADMHRLTAGSELKAERLFDSLPAQLMRPLKRFSPSLVQPGARSRSYQDALTWLTDAMLINPCYRTTEPSLGLRLNRREPGLKPYMADTGLLISHAFDERGHVPPELYQRLLHGKLEVNRGMLTENIVAQMLTANRHGLYYFSRTSKEGAADRMEVDFLITKPSFTNAHNICPLEVKSGKRYSLTSLNKFRHRFAAQLDTAYVVHDGLYKTSDGVTYLPYYMVPFL